MSYTRSMIVIALCLVAAAASPVRRSPDLEARRRSAIDRSMIRFGRSYPREPSAAELREIFQRPSRRGDNFLRFGKCDECKDKEIQDWDRLYEQDFKLNLKPKKSASFVRFGRDPSFIRLGRMADEDRSAEQSSELEVNGYPQRKNRARDHFIRLGRDSEELNDSDFYEVRKKRSAECQDCQS